MAIQAGRFGKGGIGMRFLAGSEICLFSTVQPDPPWGPPCSLVFDGYMELTAGIRSRPLTSTVQFAYLYTWKVFMECGQGGEGIRLPRLANTTVPLPLPASFTTSSPRKFQDTGTRLYLVLRLRLYGFVPLLLHT